MDVVVIVAICRQVSRAAIGRVGFLHCPSLKGSVVAGRGVTSPLLGHPRTEAILEGHRASGCLYVTCMWRRYRKRTKQAGDRKRNIKQRRYKKLRSRYGR